MKVDISVIIPVLNEASRINDAVKNLYSQGYPGTMEIIVVDGRKDGSTIKCIQNPGVMKICSAPGRGIQMNRGAEIASGEILVFLHADTLLPENAFHLIQEVMKDKNVNSGAFDLSIDGKAFTYRIIEKAASLRSRITGIPYGDQAIFIRKPFFFRIGKYREIPIMEDVDLMRRIKKAKGRVCFIEKPVKTSSRRWEKEGILQCILRNWLLMALYLCGITPGKLAKFYKHPSA
ncbi:MAG: TIGR04283 family arsenosugar biosynthesis glycosyltransferase [Desulfobacula sp.]|jgi:rSAM/selenodomain-associated transferase 2